MQEFRISGEIETDVWTVLDEHHGYTPFIDPQINEQGVSLTDDQRLYRYFFNVSKVGTFSRFKIENLGPDSHNGTFQTHANILSISKLLLFGTISNNRVFFSPAKVKQSSSNLLKLGALSMLN